MTSTDPRGAARVATLADTDAIVATITTAFLPDPLWGPAFPDEQRRAAQAAAMWQLYVCSALRYPWTLVTPNVHAAAVWIPPGGTELTQHEEDGLPDLLAKTVGSDAARAILAIYDRSTRLTPPSPAFT